MSYKQYYCNEDQGMRLRSGTVINCFKVSTLWRDYEEATSYSTYNYSRDGNMSTQTLYCTSLHAILSVLEKHIHSITENPKLLKFYKMVPVKLAQLAEQMKNRTDVVCNCCKTDKFWKDMWKAWRYNILYKFVDQQHTNEETIQRIERLLQRYKSIQTRQERAKMRVLTTCVNEDCARLIIDTCRDLY